MHPYMENTHCKRERQGANATRAHTYTRTRALRKPTTLNKSVIACLDKIEREFAAAEN